MIVIGYQALTTAFNAANVPALKSLFTFGDALGAANTTFADSIATIGGFTVANIKLTKKTNSYVSTLATTIASVTGIPTIAATENFIVFGTVIIPTGGTLSYGDIAIGATPYVGFYETGGNIKLSAGGPGVGNFVDFASGAAPHATNYRAFAVWGKPGAGQTISGCVDGTAVASAVLTNAVAINCVGMTFGNAGGTEAFELGMLKPVTMPTNAFIQGMVNWLAYNANLGNKVAFPGAIGMA